MMVAKNTTRASYLLKSTRVFSEHSVYNVHIGTHTYIVAHRQ